MPGDTRYRQVPIMRQLCKPKVLLLTKVSNTTKIHWHSKV